MERGCLWLMGEFKLNMYICGNIPKFFTELFRIVDNKNVEFIGGKFS